MAAVGHCGVIDAYVEFDETHCVLQSVVQSFIDGSATWDEVLEGKMSKVYLGTATTTSTTPRPAAPRTQAGESVRTRFGFSTLDSIYRTNLVALPLFVDFISNLIDEHLT